MELAEQINQVSLSLERFVNAVEFLELLDEVGDIVYGLAKFPDGVLEPLVDNLGLSFDVGGHECLDLILKLLRLG